MNGLSCTNCFFGRRMLVDRKKNYLELFCTLQQPTVSRGFPKANSGACCAYYTTYDGKAQPLRCFAPSPARVVLTPEAMKGGSNEAE